MWYAFDLTKVLCNENNFIQPHSLWHLFSGIAAFYFYMYIRSEKNRILTGCLPAVMHPHVVKGEYHFSFGMAG